jgi:hypothetical protein
MIVSFAILFLHYLSRIWSTFFTGGGCDISAKPGPVGGIPGMAGVLAKVEYFNPGGSVKDRICLSMIEDAEAKGILKILPPHVEFH